jgi:hypothetical protein
MGENKRRYVRASVLMYATVFRDDEGLGTFRVQNLSIGGALLEGVCPVNAGEDLELLLELASNVVLRTQATVVRASAASPATFALSFHPLPTTWTAAIQSSVNESLAAVERANVLIVCDREETGIELRADLQALGHNAVSVGGPLEVLRCLELGKGVEIAIVDSAFCNDAAGGLFQLLASEHPRIRRILLVDPATAHLPRHGFAERVLEQPWNPDLLRALFAA